MRTVVIVVFVVLISGWAAAQDHLTSPYRQQMQSGLRGLNEQEIADLKAGRGMGLARAAELHSYPGPRHVLDAVAQGKLSASPDQVQNVQQAFDTMKREAQRIGTQILAEEERLETAFQNAAITEPDLRSQVARLATLYGELRTIHLRAHLATRAILSDAQIDRYNVLRGYATGSGDHMESNQKH
jgi:hypothetical protein